MSALLSLIPGLEEIVAHGDARRRSDAIRRISDLFLRGSATFGATHVELFDSVLASLVPHADTGVCGELAERLSVLPNAPPHLVELLVRDDDIMIAGPLLRCSLVVREPTLVDIACEKSQTHLSAITDRPTLPPVLTDVIIRRGDGEVVRKVAANAGALFSPAGYSGMIRRAEHDGVLAATVSRRDDLPPAQLIELLSRAPEAVRRQLSGKTKPGTLAPIRRAVAEHSGPSRHPRANRGLASAQRAVEALQHGDGLTEDALMRFARGHHYDETVAALSAISGVRISTVDHLLRGERDDPILILGKSIGASWATVRALMALRLGSDVSLSALDVEEARQNFERLVPATAKRVLAFWQARDPNDAAGSVDQSALPGA